MKKAQTWEANGSGLKSWLFRVARNFMHRLQNARKDQNQLKMLSLSLIQLTDMPPTGASILPNTMERALAALPETPTDRDRAEFHYEGFSGSEAANLLDISVEAVESLLARASPQPCDRPCNPMRENY